MKTDQIIKNITEVINNSINEEELLDIIWSFCGKYGVNNFLFGAAIYHNLSPVPKIHVLSGYPKEWRERYDDKQYIDDDITVIHCKANNTPFIWPNKKNMTEASKKIFLESAVFKIRSGISFPYHGATNEFGMFSVSSQYEFRESTLKNPNTQYIIQIIGAALFDYYRNNSKITSEIKLTAREVECLKWVAIGKTSWEISMILVISERTVIYHINNATSKMGVVSRTAAAVIATMNGII